MTKIKLVFVPALGMGHLLSAVKLAKLIVERNPNISILIIIYHVSVHELTKITSNVESQSTELDPNHITFITLPPLSNTPDVSSPSLMETAIQLQNPLVKKAVLDRHLKPVAFVLDFMNASIIDVANELQVPYYIFFAAGANLLHTMLHFQALADQQGVLDITGLVGEFVSEVDLRGFRNRVPTEVLPWVYFDKDSGWRTWLITLPRRFREAKGILVNSYMEFESFSIRAPQEQDLVLTVYPVGPILSLNNCGDSNSSNKVDEENIIRWLDEQLVSFKVFFTLDAMYRNIPY